MKGICTRIIATTGIVVVAGVAQAASIYSTSFEAAEGYYPLPANSYIPYYGDGTVGTVNGGYTGVAGTLGDGWVVLPSAATTGIDLVRDLWPGTPPTGSGDQWIDLIGTNGPGGILRTFSVTAGTTYTLSWYDFSNVGGNTYDVVFGGAGLTTMTPVSAWTAQSITFTAASTGVETLSFFNKDTGTGNTGIDMVNIGAVPEPFTMALGGAGLALAINRRRRAKKV